MQELTTVLKDLADQNHSGAAFLAAYGVTWLVCAYLWRVMSARNAALATLFQGMVALPVALGISATLGMFNERPGGELITQLSMLVAMSQLLVLPFLIVLHSKKQYSIIPLLFALAGAIHFVPYAWIYQTPVYIAMAVVLAIGLAVLYATDSDPSMSRRSAGASCALAGVVLLASAGVLLIV